MLTLFANIPTRVTDIVIFLEHDKCIERPRGGWVGDDISIENSSSSTCPTIQFLRWQQHFFGLGSNWKILSVFVSIFVNIL